MKLAIVLPGGGACGRGQAAKLNYVMTELNRRGISVSCFYGTSVGGLNSLAIAQDPSRPEVLGELWGQIKNNKDVFLGMLQFGNICDDIGMISQTFGNNKGRSILDPSPLYRLIDRTFGDENLISLKGTVSVNVTNMTAGLCYTFTTFKNPLYKVENIAKATAAMTLVLPGVIMCIEGQDVLCSDGGLLKNNPVSCAIADGCTHVILLGTFSDDYPVEKTENKILSMAPRTIEIEMHNNEEESWREKEIYELKNKIDPVKYPLVKIFDSYPKKNGSPLNFANPEQWTEGETQIKTELPDETLEAFFTP